VGVGLTTVGWITVTLLTAPTDEDTLRDFHARIRPQGPGWRAVIGEDGEGEAPGGLAAGALAWFLGCVAVYAALFGTGFLLYGQTVPGALLAVVAVAAATGVLKLLPVMGLR
jgi:hypothetical protein